MKRTLVVAVGSLLLGCAGFYLVAGWEVFYPSTYAAAVWTPGIVLLCLASVVAMWGAPSWRLAVLSSEQGSNLPFHVAFYIQMATSFGATLTPGNSGGAPVTAMALNRLGIPLGRGIGIAVQIIVIDLVFFSWSVPLSLLYLLASQQLYLPAGSVYLAALLVALFASLTVVLIRYPRLMVRALLALARMRFLKRFRRRVRQAARDYYRSVLRFQSMPWHVWLALQVLTVIGWVGSYALFWGLLELFGNQVGPLATFAVLDLVILVGNVVPTPGGSGFMEAVVGLSTRSLNGVVAVTAPLLVWRLITFYLIFLLGPIATALILVSRRLSGGRRGGKGELGDSGASLNTALSNRKDPPRHR